MTLLQELGKQQIEILKYSNDPVAFMTDLLGLDCEPFHQEWLGAFEDNRFVCLLAPRGHGKCFQTGSLVTMEDGSFTKIEDCKVGDKVICIDEIDNTFKTSTITNTINNGIKPTYKITLNSDKSTTVTSNHPFYNGEEWISIDDGLSVGDRIVVPKSDDLKRLCSNSIRWDWIKSIEYVGEQQTYGIEVEKYHNHIVDGIVSHNTTAVGSYILWRICKNRNIRILIVTINQDKANSMMTFVQEHLSKNKKLINLYGEFKGFSNWSRDQIRVKTFDDNQTFYNEPTLKVLGVTSKIISAHYDLIILDDITDNNNSKTEHQRKELEDWYNGSLVGTFLSNTNLINIGCIPMTEKVLMADNTYKYINEVLPNEYVYSYNSNGLEKKKVIASIPQGKKEVYELRTSNTITRATYDHPFLVWDKDERCLGYKKLINLTKNDFVVCPKEIKESNNSIDILNNLPFKNITPEYMWLFGFLTGDGWVTEHPNKQGSMRYIVTFSKGIYEDLNNKAKKLIYDIFGYNPSKETESECIYYRNEFGRTLKKCNLNVGAKNKDIPSWVFTQPIEYRKEFLRGLLDADGTKTGIDRYAIETVSENLIKDIKRLCKITGLISTPMYTRTRKIKAPNSKTAEYHTFYHTAVSFTPYRNKDKRYNSVLGKVNLHKDFGFERVKSKTLIGKQEVFDLSIEDNENFIVEGLVVHNTKWHEDDIHSYLGNKAGFTFMKYKALLIDPVEEPNKKAEVLWPTHLPWDVEMIKELNIKLKEESKPLIPEDALTLKFVREHQGELHFQMQYQNEIISTGISKFKPEWLENSINKFIRLDGILPTNLKLFMGVDFGGEDTTSDYFALSVVGVDERGDIYILDNYRTHTSLHRQLEIIKAMDEKWHPSRIGLEASAQQKIIVDDIIQSNPQLPIIPIKSSIVNDRDTRMDRMSLLFETNRVYMNPAFVHLRDELMIYPRGRHDDCFREDTLVKTLEGYKKIKDVQVGDLVYTHKHRYQPVIRTIKKPFNGTFHKRNFVGQLNLELSEDHKIYTSSHSYGNSKVPLKEDTKRQFTESSKWHKTYRNIIPIESYNENENYTLYEEDYYIKEKSDNTSYKSITLDKDFAYILGLFLAEGHCSNGRNRQGNLNYEFNFSFNETEEKLINKVISYFSDRNINSYISHYKDNHCKVIRINNKLYWNLFKDCYDEDKEKQLPPYHYHLGKDLQYTLDGWLDGDGWTLTNRKIYDIYGQSTSKKLALSMRDIALSRGWYAVINKRKVYRYDIECKDVYTVSIKYKRTHQCSLKEIGTNEFGGHSIGVDEYHYEGDVYDLTIENDNSFIADGMIVHNCADSLSFAIQTFESSGFIDYSKVKDLISSKQSYKIYKI
jgi:intein/homing endonuclease